MEEPSACIRFFAIDELLTLFLESAPTLVLLNCQRVCRKWNEIIADSTLMQEHLSLSPSEDETSPSLNPILWQCFGPVLATPSVPHHSKDSIAYKDLYTLPWAHDGKTLRARSRMAFARKEASWRRMLVSQPPISRLDWWHSWSSSSSTSGGWGHQDLPYDLTLGHLWDLLESRLYRGCKARITYFPNGIDPEEDETAGEMEREWAADGESQHRGFAGDVPRVRLVTEQVWEGRPRGDEKFDLKKREWVRGKQGPTSRHHAGDGFNVLREDCHSDRGKNARRWSRSEGFAFAEIHGESSGSH